MRFQTMEWDKDPFEDGTFDFVGMDLIKNLDSGVIVQQEVSHSRMFSESYSFTQSEFEHYSMSVVNEVCLHIFVHFLNSYTSNVS